MDAPTLTTLERLTLANQYKILAALSDDNEREYTRNAEILMRGYAGFYHYIFDSLSHEVPEGVADETQDVLDMFYAIKATMDELPKDQLAELNQNKLTFNGFDGNNDKHYGQAKFMVEHLDLYSELKRTKLNSHSQMDLMRYRRMVPLYKEASKSTDGLTLEVLKKLQSI